jgi:hypothetical protein
MGKSIRRDMRDDGAAAPRERFVETAYWNPSVVTSADGKATVSFRAPTALSRYQFATRGVTGADTLVGQATAELTVRKDFFVDLKAPATLNQGDIPRFLARVHHLGVKGTVELKLSVYAAGREQVFPKTVELKGDGVEEVLFDPYTVPDGDQVRLSLTALAGEKNDGLVTEIPIRPWGVQAFASSSGTASTSARSMARRCTAASRSPGIARAARRTSTDANSAGNSAATASFTGTDSGAGRTAASSAWRCGSKKKTGGSRQRDGFATGRGAASRSRNRTRRGIAS